MITMGYVVTRTDTEEGVVTYQQRYRFPSQHYYELWNKLYPEIQVDADPDDRWSDFKVTNV